MELPTELDGAELGVSRQRKSGASRVEPTIRRGKEMSLVDPTGNRFSLGLAHYGCLWDPPISRRGRRSTRKQISSA